MIYIILYLLTNYYEYNNNKIKIFQRAGEFHRLPV